MPDNEEQFKTTTEQGAIKETLEETPEVTSLKPLDNELRLHDWLSASPPNAMVYSKPLQDGGRMADLAGPYESGYAVGRRAGLLEAAKIVEESDGEFVVWIAAAVRASAEEAGE